MACGILVPPQRIELTPSVVKVQNPNQGTTRASPSNTHFKRCMHSGIHSGRVHDSQDIEGTQVSIHRWMDKEDVVRIHNGILLSHEKDQGNAIHSNMDGLGQYCAKWNVRETRILYDLTYIASLKNTTN